MRSTRAAIAGVPALVRSGRAPEVAAGRGTVLYYHGFSGHKERCEPYRSWVLPNGRCRGRTARTIIRTVSSRSRSCRRTPSTTSTCPPARSAIFTPASGPGTRGSPSGSRTWRYPGAGHFLTPELDADSGRRLVAWFERWLPG